jgi:hypothetical protein
MRIIARQKFLMRTSITLFHVDIMRSLGLATWDTRINIVRLTSVAGEAVFPRVEGLEEEGALTVGVFARSLIRSCQPFVNSPLPMNSWRASSEAAGNLPPHS